MQPADVHLFVFDPLSDWEEAEPPAERNALIMRHTDLKYPGGSNGLFYSPLPFRRDLILPDQNQRS